MPEEKAPESQLPEPTSKKESLLVTQIVMEHPTRKNEEGVPGSVAVDEETAKFLEKSGYKRIGPMQKIKNPGGSVAKPPKS